MSKQCIFCGTKTTLTNAHVLSKSIRAAFNDPAAVGSFVYRQSRQADGSQTAHSHSGSLASLKARAECDRCNAGWTREIEEAVDPFLPNLIRGNQMRLSVQDQRALASWSVVTVLLLQYTHTRAARLVIPDSDYADVYQRKSPTPVMKVFTGYLEPPGHGSPTEAAAEYLAEDRSITDISRLLEADGLPPPLDSHAYTATLRLGFWVTHVLRVGSPHFMERVNPTGPILRPCLQTIWPTRSALTWPPDSLAAIGGLLGLARSIDTTGIAIV